MRVKCESAYSPQDRCKAIRAGHAICREHGLEEVPRIPAHGRRAILACYGPSLKHTIDELLAEPGDVFTVSGAHDFLLDRGAKINGHIESDPRPHKASFLQRSQPDVDYMLASVCDPLSWNTVLHRRPYVWHVDSSLRENSLIKKLWPGAFLSAAGTNVGMSSLDLLSQLGYRYFSMHGFDASFEVPDDLLHASHIEQSQLSRVGFHAGVHPNEDQLPHRVWVGDHPFFVSPQMMQSAQDFMRFRAARRDLKFDIHGDGFVRHLVRSVDGGQSLITPGREASGILQLRTK